MSKFNNLLSVLEAPYEPKVMDSQFQRPPPREFDAEYTTYCNT